MDSITINWEINGLYKLPLKHHTHLAAGQSEEVVIGSHFLYSGTIYNLIVYTNHPNGLSDTVPYNDSLVDYINVNPSPTVNLGSDTVITVGQSIILNAGTGFTSYLWSTGDTSQTILVDSTGIGMGTKTISVTVKNSFGCIGSDTINIIFIPLGINKNAKSLSLSYYPNPSQGKCIIFLPQEANFSQIIGYDIKGSCIYQQNVENIKGYFEIDLSSNPVGLYFLTLMADNEKYSFKILITSK